MQKPKKPLVLKPEHQLKVLSKQELEKVSGGHGHVPRQPDP